MPMANSEAVSQVQSGGLLCSPYHFDPSYNYSRSTLSFNVNCWKTRGSVCKKSNNGSRMLGKGMRMYVCWGIDALSHGNTKCTNRLEFMRCKCQQTESFSGSTTDEWRPMSLPVNGINSAQNVEDFGLDQQLKHGKGSFILSSNVKATGTTKDTQSIEEEAWDLLRASFVYYCGNPIGTIAANDPSNGSPLNYDQVFIRDFIPSGIALLLKGEYDIVRNFILYTLQLQVMLLSFA